MGSAGDFAPLGSAAAAAAGSNIKFAPDCSPSPLSDFMARGHI